MMRSSTKTRLFLGALAGLGLLGALQGTAQADFAVPRYQVDQKGDFVLLGSSLGFDCAAGLGIPAPIVGAVGACGMNTIDTAMDVYWRSDSPAAGQAEANLGIGAAQARTTAVLTLPPGSSISKAYLYWSATTEPPGGADAQVTVERPGVFNVDVNALQSYDLNPQAGLFLYHSVADVTALVQAQGPGAYRISGVSGAVNGNLANNLNYAGWWMAVFYELATDPPRNLALFDGLEVVSQNPGVTTNIAGFKVPNAGFDAKLGVVTFEGDATTLADELRFKGNLLTDALNPANNFFNRTHSFLGVPVSAAGDLPQVSGAENSLAGMDIDVVDVKGYLVAGDTQAQIQANTGADAYFLAGFVTSISTFAPDFNTSAKSVVDLNGGDLLPGDVLEYSVVAVNNGNDTSINTRITDVIPAGVTYVPGSIEVSAGANVGVKTDGAGDDQGEYDAATHTVTVRLGAGAGAAMGGTIAPGASSTVKFKVTVDADASGSILNQATITAAGQQGAPQFVDVTDGNGPAAGAPPTAVLIDACTTDLQCSAPTPHCFTAPNPNQCVECFLDNHCGAQKPSCDLVSNTCACVPIGAEICGNAVDEDCDGAIDNGCAGCMSDAECGGPNSGKVCDPAQLCVDGCRGMNGNGCLPGEVCSSMDASIGQCFQCLVDADCGGPMSAKVCDDVAHACVDGCRGMNGNGCAAGDVCTSPDATIGACVECLVDADCGGPMSAKVCDGMICKDGCRGMNGNGCAADDVCTSPDATIGACVECLVDADCGGPMSARVCDGMICKDGCRGVGGNGCMADKECTSKDATIGVCVECLVDADCGDLKSGKVCSGMTCKDGCRGKDGNGCPDGLSCSSIDATIGVCFACSTDADCGAKGSGKVCDDLKTCVDGCRGTGGNGCAVGLKCSSLTAAIGDCQGCVTDADCGGANSGKICDDPSKTCVDGCRGTDGNGCIPGIRCSSLDSSAGLCGGLADGVVAEGDGILCATRPGNTGNDGSPWLFSGAVGLALAWRRRRRAA